VDNEQLKNKSQSDKRKYKPEIIFPSLLDRSLTVRSDAAADTGMSVCGRGAAGAGSPQGPGAVHGAHRRSAGQPGTRGAPAAGRIVSFLRKHLGRAGHGSGLSPNS